MKFTICLALFCGCFGSLSAQQSDSTVPQPKTKLEQFQAKAGSVIIMGFTSVGTVSGLSTSSVKIEVRELIDAATSTKQSGIFITATKVGGQMGTSFVDADEIESLIKGIDYISTLTGSATKLPRFQADYRTRGDLGICTFTQEGVKNELGVAIAAGRYGTVTVFMAMEDLTEFRGLLQKAQTILKAL